MDDGSERSGVTGLKIGVVIRDAHLKSRMRVFEGASAYALEHSGISVFLIPSRNDTPPDREALARVDGLILWAAPGDLWVRDVWVAGTPVVNCNDAFIGVVPTVSNCGAHHRAFDFLLSLGRHTIGYVASAEVGAGCPDGAERFNKRARLHGLKPYHFDRVRKDPALHPEQILTGKDEPELEGFLTGLPKPAALWCSHDEMAMLVWMKAGELGIRVPGEIAIMGYGDHPCAMHGALGLTTVELNGNLLGFEAARLIHDHLRRRLRLTESFLVAPEPGAMIIERASTGGTNPSNRGIQKAWRLLEKYPDEGITVKQLVRASRVSRATFYEQFAKAFGLSPGKAIRNARLRKAKEFLASTDMSIRQIGNRCGFSIDGTFSNFIRRETGMTPAALRRHLQRQPEHR